MYEDLIYSEPFQGKAAVRAFLRQSRENAPPGLRFVLDDVSDGEDACGLTWHLEIDVGGEAKKITKGISFYRVDPTDRRIMYVLLHPCCCCCCCCCSLSLSLPSSLPSRERSGKTKSKGGKVVQNAVGLTWDFALCTLCLALCRGLDM